MVTFGPALLVAGFLVLATSAQVTHMAGGNPLGVLGYSLLAASGLVLGLRRRLPALTYAATVLLSSGYFLAGHPPGPIYLAPLAALVSLGARARLQVSLPAAALGAALMGAVHVFTGGTPLSAELSAAGWLAAAALAVAALRVRARFQAEARARAQWARRSHEEEERRRSAEGRLGIAREVHDVVGHSLAVISLQAGVAEHLMDTRPEEARKAVSAIREVSRQALTELRVELALLRGDGSARERGPAPGIETIADLVASTREAGLSIDLDQELKGRQVPGVVGAAAYRIVQESLTNVARHAGAGARAHVRLRLAGDRLEVEVLDDGQGATGSAAAGTGVQGMRERASALGGELTAGGRPEGGFRVHASLPWGPG